MGEYFKNETNFLHMITSAAIVCNVNIVGRLRAIRTKDLFAAYVEILASAEDCRTFIAHLNTIEGVNAGLDYSTATNTIYGCGVLYYHYIIIAEHPLAPAKQFSE